MNKYITILIWCIILLIPSWLSLSLGSIIESFGTDVILIICIAYLVFVFSMVSFTTFERKKRKFNRKGDKEDE